LCFFQVRARSKCRELVICHFQLHQYPSNFFRANLLARVLQNPEKKLLQMVEL
jgi:hypothetical protein